MLSLLNDKIFVSFEIRNVFKYQIYHYMKANVSYIISLPYEPVNEIVIDLRDLLRKPLVLSPEKTEKLTQEGAGDKLLISSVTVKQFLLHPLTDPLPILEVLINNPFNLRAIKPLYRDHCGEMMDMNQCLQIIQRSSCSQDV